MTRREFLNLIVAIRQGWSVKDGIIALLSTETEKDVLRLCVPPDPTAVMAESCILWKGDDKLYEGKLSSDKLQEVLNENKVNGVVYRTFRQLNRPYRRMAKLNAE